MRGLINWFFPCACRELVVMMVPLVLLDLP